MIRDSVNLSGVSKFILKSAALCEREIFSFLHNSILLFTNGKSKKIFAILGYSALSLILFSLNEGQYFSFWSVFLVNRLDSYNYSSKNWLKMCHKLKILWPDAIPATLCCPGQRSVWLNIILDSAQPDCALSWTARSLTVHYPGQRAAWLCIILDSAQPDWALSWTALSLTQGSLVLEKGAQHVFFSCLAKIVGEPWSAPRRSSFVVKTSVVDPDPYWIRIQELPGSVFGIQIRIHTCKYRLKWRQKM